MDITKPIWFKRSTNITIVLFIFSIITLISSFMIGRYLISFPEVVHIMFAKFSGQEVTWSETVDTVLFKVRFPRIIAAVLIGSSLSLSGAAYQGMFKNPMVSPDILGASAGAGFGAALAILSSFNIVGIQITAFLFGLAAVALTYFISTFIGRNSNTILVLVLTGMVVSTLFSSFISLAKYVADPYSKLPEITFWLLGGLASISLDDIKILLIPIVLGSVPLLLLRWQLNVLSFGEEEAKAMGVNTSRLRLIVIICATLMTAASVSISGMIGWVGLVIPHLTRMIVGPNYKILIPYSMLIGSTYLLIVDNAARSLFTLEIPLGIVTALIGAPFFIYLLMKGRRGWL